MNIQYCYIIIILYHSHGKEGMTLY